MPRHVEPDRKPAAAQRREFTLIVPPVIETMTTGLRLAAEKTIHRALWRVEFWSGETYPRLKRNGAPVSVAQTPEHAARFANHAAKFLVRS